MLIKVEHCSLCEQYAVRLQVSNMLALNCSTAGIQGAPKSFIGSMAISECLK